MLLLWIGWFYSCGPCYNREGPHCITESMLFKRMPDIVNSSMLFLRLGQLWAGVVIIRATRDSISGPVLFLWECQIVQLGAGRRNPFRLN
jgi:hypothetical protein